ncbi:MAG: AAA family ATPase [Candidatus Hermodarchaeota archaeon]
MSSPEKIMRSPPEIKNKEELLALRQEDEKRSKPANWLLSPKTVMKFIVGTKEPVKYIINGQEKKTQITRKFYGDDILIQRAIATLASNRGLLLIGEPGTAKSWLSEHLAAAISGDSLNIIQGTAGTTEDQIKYSWNYALLLAKGPSLEAMVPAPLYKGMKEGKIVRFEEITRCPQEIQDTIISILSEKVLAIPELPPPDDILFATPGFNIIGTANTRDRGVNEMSSALKRRFNFETISPLESIEEETQLVTEQTEYFLAESGLQREIPQDVIELLTTTFNELRRGVSEDGRQIDQPTAIMSTAEAVDVSINASLYSHYIEDTQLSPKSLVLNLIGTIVKDNREDLEKLQNYFDIIIKARKDINKHWNEYYEARKYLR